jgi:hypothetical protein
MKRRAKRVRRHVAETRILVRRVTFALITGIEINCGQKFTARDPGRRPGLVHARDGGFQLLVGLQRLGFKRVQIRVTEKFPPISLGHVVEGLADFPIAVLRRLIS